MRSFLAYQDDGKQIQSGVISEGKLLEKLVHYSSDGPNSEKWLPDEELGETSDERYQEFNNRALFVLGSMHKLARTFSGQ